MSNPGPRRSTAIQHAGEEERVGRAVVPPIFQTSLFVFDDLVNFWDAYDYTGPERPPHSYSRVSNPTLELLEHKLALLEGTEDAKVFGSGMAAISAAILSSVSAGSHVICVDTAYGPTRKFLAEYLCRFGVETTFVVGAKLEEFEAALRSNTNLIVLESPSSFFFLHQDLAGVAALARERGITTMIDNSYASPLRQNPAAFGIDLVVHSASKYLNGHSDLTAGVVCASRERVLRLMEHEVQYLGGALAPMMAWLLLRGLRTLEVRLDRVEATALRVARWLRERPEVARVHHPALHDDPDQQALYARQMSGTTGLFSFEPAFQEQEDVFAFVESLRVFQRGVSWGGHESLVVALPLTPLHVGREHWVVRLYCGLEDPEDLIEDLHQAFRLLGARARRPLRQE